MSKSLNSKNGTENRPPSPPRWVKISGIIAIAIIFMVVIILFIHGGQHGPSRHGLGNHGTEGELRKQIGQNFEREQSTPIVVRKTFGGRYS
ncbi:hypothetical protein ACFSCX_24220 [Bacillus salitolerans]|uniref:Uncharacterized protein n=1 Tax=Bacillus salitolerans TaxID=1437434 RepID=A0ABW4LWX2_9BACI